MHSEGAVVQHSRGPLTSSPFVAIAVRGKQGTTNSSNSLGSLEEHFGALNMVRHIMKLTIAAKTECMT